MRRLCELACAIVARPKLLLLDEPTAGIAQREVESMAPVIRAIRDELQCSILIVEHDVPFLVSLCDRMYALEAGRVIAEGNPESVRNDPLVIASYLGTDPHAIARSFAPTPPARSTARARKANPAKRPRATAAVVAHKHQEGRDG
jgi:ABC-type lipopolysaccharide export system ATPase subunit